MIAISLWRIPESRNATVARVDWLGATIVTLGLGGLVSGFIESVTRGWRHPLVFGSLMVGFGCLVAFVIVEASGAWPTGCWSRRPVGCCRSGPGPAAA